MLDTFFSQIENSDSNNQSRRKYRVTLEIGLQSKEIFEKAQSSFHLGRFAQTQTRFIDRFSELRSVECYRVLKPYTAKVFEICLDFFKLILQLLKNHLNATHISVMVSWKLAKFYRQNCATVRKFVFRHEEGDSRVNVICFTAEFTNYLFTRWEKHCKMLL